MRVRVTTEYLDPLPDGTLPEPFVVELTGACWESHREVYTLYNRDGSIRALAPSRTTHLTLKGLDEAPLAEHHYEYPGHRTDGGGSLGATGVDAGPGNGGAAAA